MLINRTNLNLLNRVYCALNYYGDGCNTFCRPRDDQFGHYNCSLTGQKLCLEGWLGPECDRAKCRDGCNQQHGYCDRPDSCQCRPGWTGARCDECLTHPGCANGYCLSPWQCICKPNWGGILCDQDLDYCGTHEPCKNNGICQNIAPGKYKCNCPQGYAGVNCDLNLNSLTSTDQSVAQLSAGCALNPCLNGGTCFGFQNLLTNFSLSFPSDSINQESDQVYRCQCLPGWTGDYCQWLDSSSLTITEMILSNNATSSSEKMTNSSSLTVPRLVESSGDNEHHESEHHDTVNRIELIEATDNKLSLSHNIHTQSLTSNHHSTRVDLRHIISWVMLASTIGVFLASIILAWCCLIAIKQNRFSFIHMSIVRDNEFGCSNQVNQMPATSRFRRVQARIRDSLRSSRIKTSSKLNIENVLKPPPSYEESKRVNKSMANLYHSELSLKPPIDLEDSTEYNHDTIEQVPDKPDLSSSPSDNQSDQQGFSLVMKGALNHRLSTSKLNESQDSASNISPINESPPISTAQLSCPRHGSYYRQRMIECSQSKTALSSNQVISSYERDLGRKKTTNHCDLYIDFHESL